MMMSVDGPSSPPSVQASPVTVLSAAAAAPQAPSSTPCVTRADSVDELQPILLQQAFDGSWNLGHPFATVIGISLDKLHSSDGLPDAVWATALGLAFLHVRLASREM